MARVVNKTLLKELHLRWRECALCGDTGPRSLHHVHKHPRDDLEANLIMLCGDGVQGCHGRVEAHDESTLEWLGVYLIWDRQDTIDYLVEKLGESGADEWLRHQLRVS